MGITFFLIIGIYYLLNSYKINYVAIGNNLIKDTQALGYNDLIKDYLESQNKLSSFNTCFYNNSIMSLTEDIKKNRTIWFNDNEYFIKKVLRESDFLVISIGMDELASHYDKQDINHNNLYFQKMYDMIENLIYEVKKYAQGKIIFLGYYNPTSYYDSKTDEFFYNVNLKLNRLMMNNGITYIELYEKMKGHRFQNDTFPSFPNNKGYQEIARVIEFYL